MKAKIIKIPVAILQAVGTAVRKIDETNHQRK